MPRIPRFRLLAYTLPALPLAALGIPVHVHLPTFYAEDMGLGLAATGTALLVARLFDVAVDPLIGLACDRWRRRLWLMMGVPLLVAAGWQLFLPPDGVTAVHLMVWSAIFYLGLTLVLVPYQAWGAELSPDYGERSRIAGWREGFALVGVLAAIAGPAVMSLSRPETMAGFFPPAAFLLVVTVIAAVATVSEAPRITVFGQGSFASALPLARNRPFRRLILAQGLNAIANALPATLFLLFVGDGLGRPDLAGPLLLVYFLAAIGGIAPWLAVARRMGKHRAWRLSLALTALAFLPIPFLNPNDWVAFAVICVLTGLGLAADLALPPAILADVVDEHEADGGGQRAGLYVALWSLTGKVALAVAVGFAFPILDFSGFVPSAVNAGHSLLILALLYAGLPVLLKLGAVIVLHDFPLDEARQAELRRRIALLSET